MANSGTDSKKVLHYKVDWRLDNYGTAYPLSIYQYDENGKPAYDYEDSSYKDGTLLTIYEDNTKYIIKPKYSKIDWHYTDLNELAKQYDYKNDYFGKIDYEYSGDKVVRETKDYPNGCYEYNYNHLVTEYTYDQAGLVARKIITGTEGRSGRADLKEVYEYEYDANGNTTKINLNGKYVDEYFNPVLERKYDDHNNVILIVRSNGTQDKYERTYNSKGLQTRMILTYILADGTSNSEDHTYEYDDHDNVISDKSTFGGFTFETRHEYKYDEKGEMIFHWFKMTGSNGYNNEQTWSHKFEYDKDGDLIKDSDLLNERNWTEYIYWGAEPNNKEAQNDNPADLTTTTTETETNQSANAKNLAGFVRTSDYPLTPGMEKDEMYTIIGKTMKIDDWFDELKVAYIDEVTTESLDKVTADLVAAGCRAIIFDIGDLSGVYGRHWATLAARYPNVDFYPKVSS